MELTSVGIISVAVLIGLIFTTLLIKYVLRSSYYEGCNEYEKITLVVSHFIGAFMVFKSTIATILYTIEIISIKNIDILNNNFNILFAIYFLIYIITIIVFHIIARIMSKYIKFDLKSDFRFYILSLLFVGLCYLTTPILDNVYDFYKPSVKTEFYR